MSEVSSPEVSTKQQTTKRSFSDVVASTEIDTRMFGMVVALVVIWVGFHLMSDGAFLTSRNLWNLSVQSTSIAIMSTGMVLIIVSRNIDLSVGSLLGFIGYSMALVQTDGKIALFGFDITIDSLRNQPYTWLVALAVGLVIGALAGTIQGFVVAYVGVPAFIVTLGGFLVWRGMIFRTGDKQGQTLAPLDENFRYLGGAPDRSLGAAGSWVIAIVGCAAIAATTYLARRRRIRHELTLRPMWVDVAVVVVGSGLLLAAVGLVATGYDAPVSGNPAGIAYPVVILIAVTVGMTYLAKRRRFGRYVYAYGGNPEAAELGGINTRRTVMFTFVVMGVLCAISAAVQTARLNAAVTNLGVQNELDVISAAVIGGTSFAGGIGTIFGAVLGAVIMQSLRSGMVLLKIDSPSQDIVVGVVLVTAVAVDSALRLRRRGLLIGVLVVGLAIAAIIIQTGRQ